MPDAPVSKIPARLTKRLAARFARIALSHVGREYPNKLDHVLAGPADLKAPRVLHPIFYGSLDWHSCVHAFWLLAHIRRRFPALPESDAIAVLFADRITAETVAGECDYLSRRFAGGFERPYGWAWLLMLVAELARDGMMAEVERLRPLAHAFVLRLTAYLSKAAYPVRTGTHANTAFALAFALEYAEQQANAELDRLLRETARTWYAADADCQAWEPDGEDFLSPALIEAECMRRVLPPSEFRVWFDRFLPRLAAGEPATLFRAARVSDRSDGRIVHLDGLNLSRAWCFRLLGGALGPDDPRRSRLLAAAEDHLALGLPHLSGDYMGEHWLATFAVLALEAGPPLSS